MMRSLSLTFGLFSEGAINKVGRQRGRRCCAGGDSVATRAGPDFGVLFLASLYFHCQTVAFVDPICVILRNVL